MDLLFGRVLDGFDGGCVWFEVMVFGVECGSGRRGVVGGEDGGVVFGAVCGGGEGR